MHSKTSAKCLITLTLSVWAMKPHNFSLQQKLCLLSDLFINVNLLFIYLFIIMYKQSCVKTWQYCCHTSSGHLHQTCSFPYDIIASATLCYKYKHLPNCSLPSETFGFFRNLLQHDNSSLIIYELLTTELTDTQDHSATGSLFIYAVVNVDIRNRLQIINATGSLYLCCC